MARIERWPNRAGGDPKVPATDDDDAARELDRILGPPTLLRAVHQPIVELATGGVVGYEALVRGPDGSPLHAPAALFDAADRADRLSELDWLARDAGGRDFPPDVPLFVNVEPRTLRSAPPAQVVEDFNAAKGGRQIVVELTERDIGDDPSLLVDAAERVRRWGWRVALDDVGSEPASLALLPLVAPDIIKFDMRIVQTEGDADIDAIAASVRAHADSTAAIVLAEGIEIAEQADRARSLGAELGQGWHYGHPAARDEFPVDDALPIRLVGPDRRETSVHAVIGSAAAWAQGPAGLVASLRDGIEAWTATLRHPPVVLSTFTSSRALDGEHVRRLGALAQRGAVVCVATPPGDVAFPPGVHHCCVRAGDPGWTGDATITVGLQDAVAFVAEPGTRDASYVLTHDRALVLRLARTLLAGMSPAERRVSA